MSIEEAFEKIAGYEKDISHWDYVAGTATYEKKAYAANMDSDRVKRSYKRFLLELTAAECDEVKELASQKGVELKFFDELNTSDDEKLRIKTERERIEKEYQTKLEGHFEAHPDKEKAYREAIEAERAEIAAFEESIKPNKKGLPGGIFGKK